LTIPEIAAGEGLSNPYAAKLLAMLRQAGLIESVRGRAGGYRLGAPPADIRLGAVLLALGEPLFDDPGFCQQHTGTETNGRCVRLSGCNLRALWRTLDQWVRRTLDQITLADLLENDGRIPELIRSRLNQAVQESAVEVIPLRAR
jgi:Rrf2 family protein